MPLFFAILLGTLIVLAICACFIAPLLAWLVEWRSVKERVLASVVCLLTMVTLATVGISLIGGEDPSTHCAAGTRYIEETHGAGKTQHTDWWCIPA